MFGFNPLFIPDGGQIKAAVPFQELFFEEFKCRYLLAAELQPQELARVLGKVIHVSDYNLKRLPAGCKPTASCSPLEFAAAKKAITCFYQ